MRQEDLYPGLMAAYVRGCAIGSGAASLPEELLSKPLKALSDNELQMICLAGKSAGLKLYRFKNTHDDLPRVRKVLGFLKGIQFENLLDIGSGRGVFLLPFLTQFPWVKVTSADILEHRVRFLQQIADGGVDNLTAVCADLCEQPFPDKSFDVVTILEVLEHIPEVDKAVQSAVNMARNFVVVSVPNQPDNNPEHIHLLTKEKLTALFQAAGCKRLSFDGVNGHLIMIATLDMPCSER